MLVTKCLRPSRIFLIVALLVIFGSISPVVGQNRTGFDPDDPCGTGKPMIKDWERLVKDVVSWVIMAALLFVSFTLGCGTDFDILRDVLKRPVGLLLGIACQFGIMPAIGYGLSTAVDMPNYPKLATMIMASCPGGSLSNVVSYWIGGDLTLSLAMSTASSTLGLGFVPLLMYVYGQTFDVSIAVPYNEIAIVIASLAVPVAIGMIMKWKKPDFANRITKVGGIIGIIASSASGICLVAIYAKTWVIVWQFFVVAGALPALGFLSGYIVSRLTSLIPALRQTEGACRTVATETGIQNVQLAVGIINIAPTFSAMPCVQAEMAVMPLMYLMAQLIWSIGLIAFVRLRRRSKGLEIPKLEASEEDATLFDRVNRGRLMSVAAGLGGGFVPIEDEAKKMRATSSSSSSTSVKRMANAVSPIQEEPEEVSDVKIPVAGTDDGVRNEAFE